MNDANGHYDPETLSAFVDGELSESEQSGVGQHLTNCHSCALRSLSAAKLKSAVNLAGARYAPPADTLARLTAQLEPKPQKRMRFYSFQSIAWAAVAAVFLVALTFAGWHQVRETNALANELFDQHLATLSSAATPEVISTDRHTVKPWFQGRLPFSFNLPDTSALPPDTVLQGADFTYLDGQPAALLLFTIHKHHVSVFLTPRGARPLVLPSNHAGFTIQSATTQYLRILAVSDVNAADLKLLMAALEKVQ
jgi:anti-sigma factor RsiW